MKLTEQEIDKYQKLFLEKYGKEISRDEAEEQLGKLVLLVRTVTEE